MRNFPNITIRTGGISNATVIAFGYLRNRSKISGWQYSFIDGLFYVDLIDAAVVDVYFLVRIPTDEKMNMLHFILT